MKKRHRQNRYYSKPRPTNAEWQQKKIAEAHAKRAGDPVKQAKIDAQARELLAERVAIIGADWHVGCAVRIPADIQDAIAKEGPDILLLMLDRG